ncbi:SMI1/KNR4 family protein [Actinacidiphila glaucinigra]|uniref:SMI1 / KNR4 family (SUKH-1) n=1 Tax=Actinacidiphila glaucinigra TaxID=235986 RepID=A0A239M3T1_9ACTN|nr:SMI1/KNR4 family protein [Actinacidiphila glaucinigra]SNT36798.1 SMI1 / KNR4 family (SUKH-1) [Actinacidiphila glaucinigra]
MHTHTGWSGVRERVIAVKEAERRARGWGTSPYPVFEPVLTAAEIADVEAQYGVELPEEYRTFLAEVGSGGPGPEIELTTLRRVDGRWGWFWDGDGPIPLDPSGPFVETDEWPGRQMETLRAAGYEPTTRDEDDDYLEDFRRVFGESGHEVWRAERVRGAILISDNGCGMTGWLIVVGPHRGELRDRECAGNPPFEPYVDASGNRHTFRTWYLAWLERCEREARGEGTAGAGSPSAPPWST